MRTIEMTYYQPKQTQGGKPSGTGMLYLNINDSF